MRISDVSSDVCSSDLQSAIAASSEAGPNQVTRYTGDGGGQFVGAGPETLNLSCREAQGNGRGLFTRDRHLCLPYWRGDLRPATRRAPGADSVRPCRVRETAGRRRVRATSRSAW